MAAAVTAAVASATAAAVTAASSVASFLREEFSVEAFGNLLLGSFAYREHCTGEVEDLACHRVVEVDCHTVFLHFHDDALDKFACAIVHRDDASRYEEVLADDAVDFEALLREVEAVPRVILTVAFFRLDGCLESVSFFLSLEYRLECRDEHVLALDVVQRPFCCGRVGYLAVYHEYV